MVPHQSNRIFTHTHHHERWTGPADALASLIRWQHEYIDLNLKIAERPYNAVGKLLPLNKSRIGIENFRIRYRATNSIDKTMCHNQKPAVGPEWWEDQRYGDYCESDYWKPASRSRQLLEGCKGERCAKVLSIYPGCELQIRGAQGVIWCFPYHSWDTNDGNARFFSGKWRVRVLVVLEDTIRERKSLITQSAYQDMSYPCNQELPVGERKAESYE